MSQETSFSPARARERLVTALAAEPPRLDLAALAIATLHHPEMDPGACLHTLDALAARVQVEVARLEEQGAALAGLEALRHVLADVEGFRGNEEDYHAPENSFLDVVLERKVGLPITLSVVYLEVARRAGIPLHGVSFPGHFLVSHELSGQRVILDPFHHGRLLTEQGCRELLRHLAPHLSFEPAMLAPAPVELIAYRMLSNLRRVYLERTELEQALAVVDMLLMLAPDHPGELRTRAVLLASLGAWRAALEDVERALALAPQSQDRPWLEGMARELRLRADMLN